MFHDIFEEIRRFKERMERTFEDFFKRPEFRVLEKARKELAEFKAPACDVFETDGEVVVRAELPGIAKEDIVLNVSDDLVEIKAEKKEEAVVEEKGYYRKERAYKGFYRTITLPALVDPERAEATFERGLLEIRMPKVAKKEKKKVEIK